METRIVKSHLPADLGEKLDGLAERRDRTLEALADVKAGRTHDHAKIEAWATTLGAPKRKVRR